VGAFVGFGGLAFSTIIGVTVGFSSERQEHGKPVQTGALLGHPNEPSESIFLLEQIPVVTS
jgi:hypothetical protein